MFDGTSALVAVVWPSFGTRSFSVFASAPVTDDADDIGVQIIESSITPTGCQVQASALFTGTVPLEILEVRSPAISGELVAVGAVARTRQIAAVSAAFDGTTAQLAVAWPDFGAKQFSVAVSRAVTDAEEAIDVQVISSSITSTGCTLQANAPFLGSVVVIAKEKLS